MLHIDNPQQLNTATRILDVAEALFMEHGFEATSLRMITQQAGVNLAAVNYHFGSKDGLLQDVFVRRLAPLNQERVADLTRLEQQAGHQALPVATILHAFLAAALRMSHDRTRGGTIFIRLLSRAFVEPCPSLQILLPREYAEVVERFKAAFAKALPHLPYEQLMWRLHFAFGTMAYALAGSGALHLVAPCKVVNADDAEKTIEHLIPFLTAALEAPAQDYSYSGVSGRAMLNER